MGLLLTCKHYIPPLKQRVKVDSYSIYLAKSRLVVKTKKQDWGRRVKHTKKNSFGLPEKKYDILL